MILLFDGQLDDIKVGASIMINGDNNSDGSVVAKNIQIRPENIMVSSTPEIKKLL
jgi:hypothetical protein